MWTASWRRNSLHGGLLVGGIGFGGGLGQDVMLLEFGFEWLYFLCLEIGMQAMRARMKWMNF